MFLAHCLAHNISGRKPHFPESGVCIVHKQNTYIESEILFWEVDIHEMSQSIY